MAQYASAIAPYELRRAARRGNQRPLGADDFVIRIEQKLGRSLQLRKPGRQPREPASDQLKLDMGNE